MLFSFTLSLRIVFTLIFKPFVKTDDFCQPKITIQNICQLKDKLLFCSKSWEVP